ncbi:MAG TPA: adenine phosphoribosyltransferase [Acidimicrobiales bacterium]|nr:adenine phosphoribosyltransferase [Acidimicrobiales bacterium]
MTPDVGWLKDFIRDVPDFPKPGVTFKDITPLLADVAAFRGVVDALAGEFAAEGVDKVVGIEARGFILAAPVAYTLGVGLIPARKAGKLPWASEGEAYLLEYGDDRVEVHADAVVAGERVLVIDDVLATGGTAEAVVRLLERLGAEIVALGFLLELGFLGGRDRLPGRAVSALLSYE